MITAQTHFTEAEMRIARRNHLKRKNLRTWFILLCGLVCMAVGCLRLTSNSKFEALDLYFVCLGIYFLFLNSIQDWRFIRRVRSSSQFNKSQKCTISEKSLQQEGEGFSATTNWDQFYETVSTPEGHLLYPIKNFFYWLPKTSFETPDDERQAHSIFRNQTKHHEIN